MGVVRNQRLWRVFAGSVYVQGGPVVASLFAAEAIPVSCALVVCFPLPQEQPSVFVCLCVVSTPLPVLPRSPATDACTCLLHECVSVFLPLYASVLA